MDLLRDKLLRVDQVAEMLNTSRRNVYNLKDQGHFLFLTVGHRSLRFLESSVRAYLERQLNLAANKESVQTAPGSEERF